MLIIKCFRYLLLFFSTFNPFLKSYAQGFQNDPIESLRNDDGTLDQEKLFDYITDERVYKKYIRPNHTRGPLRVNVSLDLYNVAWIDESTSKYALHFFLDLQWFDERLAFGKLSFLEQFHSHEIEGGMWHFDRIWKPAIYIPNNQHPGSLETDSDSLQLQITSEGHVFMRKRKNLEMSCEMDYRHYPFDTQQCTIAFESSIFSVDRLVLYWEEQRPIHFSSKFRMNSFILKNLTLAQRNVLYVKGNKFSRVEVTLLLEREFGSALLDIYFPSILIVMASWTSFWFEITSPPARVALGVTTLLTLVTSSKSVNDKLPKVSYMKSNDVYVLVCICFIFASLVEFALVNYIFHTNKRRKRQWQKWKQIQRLWQQKLGKDNGETNEKNEDDTEACTDQRVINGIIGHFKNNKISGDNEKNRVPIPSVSVNFENQAQTEDLDYQVNYVPEPKLSPFKAADLDLEPYIKAFNKPPRATNDPPPLRKWKGAADKIRRRKDLESIKENGLKINEVEKLHSNDLNDPKKIILTRKSVMTDKLTFSSTVCKPEPENKDQVFTPEDIAQEIDRKCRHLFPSLFLIFNLFYWAILFFRAP